jgi:hypothetical protein
MGLAEVAYEGVNFGLSQDHVWCSASLLMLCSHYALLQEYRRSWKNKSVYLFVVYFWFSDAVCSSCYVVSNVGMFIEQWTGKDMEGSGCGLIQAIL